LITSAKGLPFEPFSAGSGGADPALRSDLAEIGVMICLIVMLWD